ncbi:Glutathione S-transferase 2 [Papilio machaon]|uniref:Glutathione S-transferase 2 n=1 Tax=Papilio machaon TaxID=76193 RepID=A0A0N1PI75_PAPMA|nr:Glutathione S-transferase 2 [Papilio machaon]
MFGCIDGHLFKEAAAVHYKNDKTVKAKKHDDFAKNVYPAVLNKLENKGHLALGKIPNLKEKYLSFKKLYDTVFFFPKIQGYVSKLPTPVYNF